MTSFFTTSDKNKIRWIKLNLKDKFDIKDLEILKIFWENSYNEVTIFLSPWENAQDSLIQMKKLGAKLINTPMEINK